MRAAINEFALVDARTILLSFDAAFDDTQPLRTLPSNVIVVRNVVRAMNTILAACLDDEAADRLAIFETTRRIVRALLDANRMRAQMPPALVSAHAAAAANEVADSERSPPPSSASPPTESMMSAYLSVKFVREHRDRIAQCLRECSADEAREQLEQIDWTKAEELDSFLEMFYDSIKEFNVRPEPTFQSVSRGIAAAFRFKARLSLFRLCQSFSLLNTIALRTTKRWTTLAALMARAKTRRAKRKLLNASPTRRRAIVLATQATLAKQRAPPLLPPPSIAPHHGCVQCGWPLSVS